MIGADYTITDVPVVEVIVKPGSSADFPLLLAGILATFFIVCVINIIAIIYYLKKNDNKQQPKE